ncbi:hypothetical protein A9Q99_16645 [Gammaproteobacteria bacterium 45_16_T64]|nr:hypothetical protein A9Q99_16645 [Gammaproteobacteria bacterium 45_16_T64]
MSELSQAFDLSSPEFVANPYPTYERLLADAPIYWCEEREFYYVSHQPYVKALFLDPRASSDRVKPMVANLNDMQRQAVEPLTSTLSKWMLFQDPPEHTPIRKLVNQALSAKVISTMQADIQSIVDELIDDIVNADECDLIADFAYPLPAIVIALILGVPVEDRDKIKAWSTTIAQFLGAKTDLSMVAKAQQDILAAKAYFATLLQQERSSPRDNVMSQMLALQGRQPSFTDEHLIANCILLIFAGHETTTNLIGNAWLTLLQHPEQLAALRADPRLVDAAIEECLRYESPVQRMGRLVKEPITLGDEILLPGKRVLLLMGAANRDGAFVDDPNRFNIHRSASRHLAFGHGIHLCSGAALARLETKLALLSLCQRLERSELLDSQPQWTYNLGMRAMERCPLKNSGSTGP